MIELQIINKILNDKNISFLFNNGVDGEYFKEYKEEFDYILNHYTKYGIIPDRETFIAEFEDHEFFEVGEGEKYLIENIKEQHLFYKLTPFVKELANKAEKDSRDAVEYARKKLQEFNDTMGEFREGTDIILSADERKKEYEERLKTKGIIGIPTGIKELDEILHGFMKDDLITIAGRTNEGKTWLLLFFLVAAWKSGKTVLLYSGEMSEDLIGFRFDTLNKHFSNTGLMYGNENLGEWTSKDYLKYLDELKDNHNYNNGEHPPFIIVTPKDLKGKLDALALEQLIEKYEPDIIGIDQLSLMEDYRAEKGMQDRQKYTHIAEDLFHISEKYSLPVLTPVQANRDAEKKNKKDDDDEPPKLMHIYESDGIAQNSTRVLGIKQIENLLKITVRKNRYGSRTGEVSVIWDIDNGIIKPFFKQNIDEDGNEEEENISSEGADLF